MGGLLDVVGHGWNGVVGRKPYATIPLLPTAVPPRVPSPAISIIVPTLDEELVLDETLSHLCPLVDEVVVSDGGSRDRTHRIAAAHGVGWVAGEPGRGLQLNRGAAAARGDVLLFVHADTRLPEGAVDLIAQAISHGAVGGGFQVRFDSDRRLMAVGSRLASLRTRWTRVPLGDQGQFVRRDVFDRMGGFRDWPILEDLDLMRRLKREGDVAVLDAAVLTSARRFASRGVTRTLATNYTIWALYALGVHPQRLARLYRDVR